MNDPKPYTKPSAFESERVPNETPGGSRFNDFCKILDWKGRTKGLKFRDPGNYEKGMREREVGKEVQETEKLNSES